MTLAIVMITTGALVASLGSLGALQYWLGLVVIAVALAVFALRETFDVYALSAAALSLDTLLVFGVGHLLLKNSHTSDAFAMVLLLGLIASGVLAATVSGILRIARARMAEGAGSAAPGATTRPRGRARAGI